MLTPLPSTLLTLLFALPALSHASPSPSLVSSDFEISLIPRHQLFLRQVSNLQTFDQALGGGKASPITNSGNTERPFQVVGDTFTDFKSAAQRSCDNQFQTCQEVANGNGGGGGGAQKQNQNQQKQKQKQPSNGSNGGNNNNNNGGANKNGNGNGNGNGKKDRRDGFANETEFEMERRQNGGITVNQCDQQKDQCNSAQSSAKVQDFKTAVASTNIGPDPNFPDFDLICEG